MTFLHTSVYIPTDINRGENPKPLGCITLSTDRAVFAQLHILMNVVLNAIILKSRWISRLEVLQMGNVKNAKMWAS